MKKLGIILLCFILFFAIAICAYLTWERRDYTAPDIPTDFPEFTDESASLPALSQEISDIIAQPGMTEEEKKAAISESLENSGISCTDKDGNNITQDVINNVEQIYGQGGEQAVIDYFKENDIDINGLGILGSLIG